MKASDRSWHQLTVSAAKKNVGVLADNQLSFKDQVASITSKTNCTLGIIGRTLEYLEDTFIALHNSLVWPVLEYGHPI